MSNVGWFGIDALGKDGVSFGGASVMAGCSSGPDAPWGCEPGNLYSRHVSHLLEIHVPLRYPSMNANAIVSNVSRASASSRPLGGMEVPLH